MNGDSSRQAIVVGGGVIGCMSAYYLAERGWKVRLLEAGRLGGGASHGNCGYVCPSHVLPLAMPGALRGVLASVVRRDSPVYLKPRWDPQLWRWLMRFAGRCREEFVLPTARARHALLRSSMALYRDLVARESIDCQWQDQGLLLVFPTRRGFEHYRRTATLLREQFDFPVTAYEGEALTELEPALRPRQAGGWLLQGDAHLRPDRLMAELGRVLRTRGVTVEEQTPVLRLAIESGRAHGVHTADGLQRADAVVIASGARTPGFARELGCPVPIQPAKGYSLTYPPPQRPPRIPLIFEGCHVAITPMATALRVGSTMEFAGYDSTLNPRRVSLLRRAASENLREPLPEPALEEWSGWRPLTYDDLPLIGPAPSAANVIIAAGNGMIGIASATGTGKLAAQLASDEPPHIDPAPYRATRFGA